MADVCDEIIDCPHSTPEVITSGPWLMARTQDIQDGTFRMDCAARVSEATYKERTRRAVPVHGDLFYSREGTYFGTAAEVPEGSKVCLGQRMVLLRPNQELIHTRYLRYWLNSPLVQAYIHGLRAGSVAERLNLRAIRRLPVLVPSLTEQQELAKTLGALDDKIELNRKMNRTLEEIAQTLFRAWFVDFEGETDFVESELGLIPRGWRVAEVGDLVELAYGKALPKKVRNPGGVEVYGSSGSAGEHNASLVEGPGVVVGRKGTVGTVYWV
ncbi:MAG: restriction endonuclease subunit S, partial [bacterium]